MSAVFAKMYCESCGGQVKEKAGRLVAIVPYSCESCEAKDAEIERLKEELRIAQFDLSVCVPELKDAAKEYRSIIEWFLADCDNAGACKLCAIIREKLSVADRRAYKEAP